MRTWQSFSFSSLQLLGHPAVGERNILFLTETNMSSSSASVCEKPHRPNRNIFRYTVPFRSDSANSKFNLVSMRSHGKWRKLSSVGLVDGATAIQLIPQVHIPGNTCPNRFVCAANQMTDVNAATSAAKMVHDRQFVCPPSWLPLGNRNAVFHILFNWNQNRRKKIAGNKMKVYAPEEEVHEWTNEWEN